MHFSVIAQTISWWQALILGIVQGLAEFLPISSSGHLKLTEQIMGLSEMPRFFDVCLHVGTLAAVFIVFRKDLLSILRHPKQKLTYMILAATVPTVIIAVFLELILDDTMLSSLLGYGFMLTGLLLYTMEVLPRERCRKKITDMSVKDAVSRSGSTIDGGIFLGMDRKTLARFSFLMSIPAILGAFCWDILKLVLNRDEVQSVTITWFPVVLGTLIAFAVGYLSIRFMLRLIENKSFKPFAFYTFLLGFLVCLDMFVTHLIF